MSLLSPLQETVDRNRSATISTKFDQAKTVGTEQQAKLAQELFRIWVDNLWEIGTVGLTPMVQGVVVAGRNFRNVPTTLGNDWPLRSPGNARTEQFFFTR